MSKEKKICISAYACSPYQGSEPGVAWGIIYELSKHHRIWAFVEKQKFESDIKKYLDENPSFGERVQFVFIEKKRGRLLRKIWPPSYYYFYRKWQKDVFLEASVMHEKIKFDLAHHVTMGGFREPGFLFKLPIPFIWGPTGAMGFFPWRFLPILSFHGWIYYLGYNLLNFIDMRFNRRVKDAAKSTMHGEYCSFIASTNDNLKGALKYWGIKGTLIPEVGPPDLVFQSIPKRSQGQALKLVWSGVFEHRKALNLTLEALALLPKSINWELNVIGSGPLRNKWINLSKRLGVANQCRFYGQVDRPTALKVMEESHVLMISSLRDITSTVLVEGMAIGLPVVCLNHCGFSDIVDGKNGIAVSVERPKQSIMEMSAAVAYLAENEEIRYEMGCNARKRQELFSWKSKSDAIQKIYEHCIMNMSSSRK